MVDDCENCTGCTGCRWCDDCIAYHLQQCYKHGATTNELLEVFGIANLVGGSIVIPHTRRALEFWEELNETGKATE